MGGGRGSHDGALVLDVQGQARTKGRGWGAAERPHGSCWGEVANGKARRAGAASRLWLPCPVEVPERGLRQRALRRGCETGALASLVRGAALGRERCAVLRGVACRHSARCARCCMSTRPAALRRHGAGHLAGGSATDCAPRVPMAAPHHVCPVLRASSSPPSPPAHVHCCQQRQAWRRVSEIGVVHRRSPRWGRWGGAAARASRHAATAPARSRHHRVLSHCRVSDSALQNAMQQMPRRPPTPRLRRRAPPKPRRSSSRTLQSTAAVTRASSRRGRGLASGLGCSLRPKSFAPCHTHTVQLPDATARCRN
eukprot:275731-Chlamydomonas_euryale.AAC.5